MGIGRTGTHTGRTHAAVGRTGNVSVVVMPRCEQADVCATGKCKVKSLEEGCCHICHLGSAELQRAVVVEIRLVHNALLSPLT